MVVNDTSSLQSFTGSPYDPRSGAPPLILSQFYDIDRRETQYFIGSGDVNTSIQLSTAQFNSSGERNQLSGNQTADQPDQEINQPTNEEVKQSYRDRAISPNSTSLVIAAA